MYARHAWCDWSCSDAIGWGSRAGGPLNTDDPERKQRTPTSGDAFARSMARGHPTRHAASLHRCLSPAELGSREVAANLSPQVVAAAGTNGASCREPGALVVGLDRGRLMHRWFRRRL